MRIRLLTVARRVPAWVTSAWDEYVRRLPPELQPGLVEIAPARASAGRTVAMRLADEAERIRRAWPREPWVVALDTGGSAWSSAALARELARWQGRGRDVVLLVGGADGLAPDLLAGASQRWSLSALTLPHALVRVVIAEALYRAWTINAGHPYHGGH